MGFVPAMSRLGSSHANHYTTDPVGRTHVCTWLNAHSQQDRLLVFKGKELVSKGFNFELITTLLQDKYQLLDETENLYLMFKKKVLGKRCREWELNPRSSNA